VSARTFALFACALAANEAWWADPALRELRVSHTQLSAGVAPNVHSRVVA
jgi:hypothetical protein